MASFRALFILTILAIALLLRPADSVPETPGTPKKKCPLNDKTCRPGDPQAPENQEEEATAVNVPSGSTPGVPTPADVPATSEDLPEFNQELIVLGH